MKNVSDSSIAPAGLGETPIEQDFLNALMESSTDAVYFKDRQSRFLRCSKAMAPLFNVSSVEELIGKTDFNFFGQEFAQEAYDCEQAILRTGQPVIGKIEREKRLDGRLTWALASKMPLYNGRGEIIGTFGINKDITAIKEAEARVEALHKELLQTSRLAGMAEVATSVLHNVGNVLNSVNVSTALLLENARKSKTDALNKVSKLLTEHPDDLAQYLVSDPKGKQLPKYLVQLCEQLMKERQSDVAELIDLQENIEHIKEIVALQQNYAKVSGVTESVAVVDLIEDTLKMQSADLDKQGISVGRNYSEIPPLTVEKHKLLQILGNVIHNAQNACEESGRQDKRITITAGQCEHGMRVAVADNGIGIPPENLSRIFNQGFTARKSGHGFGLHYSALAAVELGGRLTASSEGPGQGATFLLELPLQPVKRN